MSVLEKNINVKFDTLKTGSVNFNESAENIDNETEAKVDETDNSRVTVFVTSDCLCAKIMLKTPKDNDKELSEDEILDELNKKGVVNGIKTQWISRLVKYQIYEKNFRIAEGKRAIDGKDGKINFNFDTKNNLVPKVLEDGSVDYKNMGFSNEVKEGDLLCEIVEPTDGEDGFDVLGNVLVGTNGKPVAPPTGLNTKLSEDGTKLYASLDGNVSVKDKKVNIRKVMVVDKVNIATGNILYSGDVTVNGDVSDGFTIRAGGNITVKGVVENAVLVAGGNIAISKGIKGKGSTINAGGSVRTAYIEMAKVSADECIYVDAVLNAEVKCGEKMIVTGRRGCIIGGVCNVSKELQVKEIGNSVNINTEITLISPIIDNKEKEIVLDKIKECNEKLNSIKDALRASSSSNASIEEKKNAVVEILIAKKNVESELKSLNAEFEELNTEKEVVYQGRIIVQGHMYPNISLNMEGLKMKNTTTRPACTITRKEDSIVFGTCIA